MIKVPLQGRHTRLSPGKGTPDLPGEGTPDPPLLEGAHHGQTLGEGTPGPPHSRQTVLAGACARLLLAPIRGQVLVMPGTRNKLRGVYVDQHLPILTDVSLFFLMSTLSQVWAHRFTSGDVPSLWSRH